MDKQDEEAIHWGMRSDRTYVSRAFPQITGDPTSRMKRFVTKVVDGDGGYMCDVEGQELVIRQTPSDRQQIKALIFEDDRAIDSLILQRFTVDPAKPDKPHRKQHFSFSGDEIDKLLWLLDVARKAKLDDAEKIRFSDAYLDEMLRGNEDLTEYLLFRERKEQVAIFERLLYDEEFFDQMKVEWEKDKPEAVWQDFFERNPWIFGLSLSPLFLTGLDGRRLEQVVQGYSVAGPGKRIDALMRTNGILSALCFVEIKTHQTALMAATQYRSGSWSVSNEVTGAIGQCHASIQSAMKDIGTKLALNDGHGNPTGEEMFLYQPRSYLVVGCLDEFVAEHGVNERKFRSFELFRRNLRTPEVITFDELLERARASVYAGKIRSEGVQNGKARPTAAYAPPF